jgi:hypothetical protein
MGYIPKVDPNYSLGQYCEYLKNYGPRLAIQMKPTKYVQ